MLNYLLDFAKDLDSLLDWICLGLPSEPGKEEMKYLERAQSEPLLQFVRILPYEFSFRKTYKLSVVVHEKQARFSRELM
ncbi:hypothetical protein HRI_003344900 [Hibiscus trionum]|uniref:Uncharacterized protein n=1 Tax=Hibiscus trionum TaxID=183268 RepID=A0A9W7MDJ5_HIBTR|nr:hypothetical protein HRI_003344900 [Hibiscus trionum]